MRAVVFRGLRDVRVEERDIPQPGPGGVLVKVEAVGICASEVEAYVGEPSRRRPPLVFGHELAVSVPGDSERGLYAVNPIQGCMKCHACRAGYRNRCLDRHLLSLDLDGGAADHVVVRDADLITMGPDIEASEVAMVEPLATVVNALGGGPAAISGRRVSIVGAGTLGLLALLTSRHWGARSVHVVTRSPEGNQRATGLGASGDMPISGSQDLVLDTVGSQESQERAISLAAPGGQVASIGMRAASVVIDREHLVRWELNLRGVYAYSDRDFGTAAALVSAHAVSLGTLIHRAPLVDARLHFEQLANRAISKVKVVLLP
jgi:threonine dehydrogenase-like Zn-dependent dehydrogenase